MDANGLDKVFPLRRGYYRSPAGSVKPADD